MEQSSISPAALSLTGLSVEFCKVLADSEHIEPQAFVREVLRYLPRIYISVCDIKPYEGIDTDISDDYDTGAINDTVTEEQYDLVNECISRLLGEYDVYLDTLVNDMQYSDTPVGVSLSEQLADIFQNLADFAATMSVAVPEAVPEIVADLKYRFHTYLADTICSALRAANMLYQSQALLQQ